MKIFQSSLQVLIFFCILYSYETTDDFSVISNNCSFLQTYNQSELTNFKNQTNFKECHNWTAITGIDSTQQFSTGNTGNIKCLLLYESFISFCNRLPKAQSKNYGIIFGKSVNLSVEQACKNLSLLPKKGSPFENIYNVITDEAMCKYLCSTYKAGKVVLDSICEDSYYYSNINVTDRPNTDDSSPNNDSIKLDPKINPLNMPPPPSLDNSPTSVKITPVAMQNSKTNDSTGTVIKPEQDPVIQNQEPIHSDKIILSGEIEKEVQNVLTDEKPIDVNNQEKEITGEKNFDNHMNIEEPETKQEEEQEALNNNQAVQNGDDMTGDQQPVPDIKIDNKADNIENDYDLKNSDKPYLEADQLEIQEKEQAVPDRFKAPKPQRYGEPFASSDADMDGNSNFFTYFSFICVAFVIGYVGYHNKQKVLALLVEGRNSRRPQRGRRPNSANYHKLDSNLEEAISSSCSKNTSHVIY